MFTLRKLGQRAFKALMPKNDNRCEINMLDVKELYDAAYAEKAKARVNLKKFKTLLAQAMALDTAYRAQLMTSQAVKYGRAA